MNAPHRFAWAILLALPLGLAALVLARPATAPAVRPAALVTRPKPAPGPSPKPTSAPYVIRRVLDTGGPIAYGRWFWDETGAPAGPVLVTVDTAAEVLSVFRGGYEIGTTAIIYGADHKPTPLGVFPILFKDAHHVSRTYGNAPMPYTLRLTPDGVSIHGSAIASNYATHGCIGVPVAFARKLFGVAQVGDRVVVTRGERLALGGAVSAFK